MRLTVNVDEPMRQYGEKHRGRKRHKQRNSQIELRRGKEGEDEETVNTSSKEAEEDAPAAPALLLLLPITLV